VADNRPEQNNNKMKSKSKTNELFNTLRGTLAAVVLDITTKFSKAPPGTKLPKGTCLKITAPVQGYTEGEVGIYCGDYRLAVGDRLGSQSYFKGKTTLVTDPGEITKAVAAMPDFAVALALAKAAEFIGNSLKPATPVPAPMKYEPEEETDAEGEE
jgi:hypothetical protein